MTQPSQHEQRFRRDRFTWIAYVLLGFYAYTQAILGPVVPFLREELNLSYTVTGLHITAFALGMVIAGLSGERIAARFGRARVFWASGAGMVLGVFLFISGRSAPITIAGTLMMGLLGSFLLVLIQSTLTDRHGEHSPIALTESNIMASIFAAVAPIMTGLAAVSVMGWRAALGVSVVVWIVVFMYGHGTAIPQADDNAHAHTPLNGSRKLPAVFWMFWLIGFVGVAAEWCMIFWSADFLQKHLGLPPETASTAVSAFLIAMIAGRVAGSALTRRTRPRNLLLGAVVVMMIGFPVFWLSTSTGMAIIGLLITGLGTANLFPMSLATVSRIAPQYSDLASARIALAAGAAIFIMPQVLGSLADVVGIFNAYAVVVVLLVVLLALNLAARVILARIESQRAAQMTAVT